MNITFYLSYNIKITLKSHFCRKNVIILSLSYVRNGVMDVITFPENLLTTSGLSILLHGVISLPDGTSLRVLLIQNCPQKKQQESNKLPGRDVVSSIPIM